MNEPMGQPGMGQPKPAASSPGASPTQDERTWGMVAHLSAFAVFIFPVAGNIIAPLIIWLTRRDTSAYVEAEAREALNFNITVTLGWIVCGLLTFALIGIPLGAVLFLGWLVLTIVAAVKATEGVGYRYPISLRLVK
jgi:uncharacterized Tic20 family protein